jgi:hypothetical protein
LKTVQFDCETGRSTGFGLLKTAGSVIILLPLVTFFACRPLGAQEARQDEAQPATPSGGSQQEFAPANAFVPHEGNLPKIAGSVDYSYVAPGDAKFQGIKESGSDAQSLHAAVAGAIPINEHWFVPLGLSSGNFWLDSVSGQPIPDRINTLRLLTGLGYRLNDQWILSAGVGPALYRLDDVSTSDLGIGGMIGALHQLSPKVTLAFGLGFNPDSDIPVLPAAGVRWAIETNLTLNLMFPRPVLIYRVSPKVSLFAGGDFKVAVFRADSDLGDKIGLPGYNHALGTYHDFHLGVGVEYELLAALSLSVEGGYSVGRQINYTRIDQTVTFDPGPYCQVGVKYRF